MKLQTIEDISRYCHMTSGYDLAMGSPNRLLPEFARDYLASLGDASAHQYGDPDGPLALRQRIARDLQECNHLQVNPERELTISAGATEGVFLALKSVVKPGDEVIIFEPVFPNYLTQIELVGGIVRAVTLEPGTWKFDPAQLERLVTSKTKAIILNSPHNPTGKIFDLEDIRAIAEICRKHQIYCIEDRVYERFVYTNETVPSVCAQPGMRELSFYVNSFSKHFHITGWRIGYIVASPLLTEHLRRMHYNIVCTLPTPLLRCLTDCFDLFLSHSDEHNQEFMQRMALVIKKCEEAGWVSSPPSGGWFVVARYPQKYANDISFVNDLIKTRKIACVPLSFFTCDGRDTGYFRLSLARNYDYMLRAFNDAFVPSKKGIGGVFY